ncbi:acyltransferase [Rhodobacter sp. NTK016B]|uniref:acyltransferase family protein n=1 Tax=Rhodobacter sp. NTK016B TaxID=2759676 RepID=UPI001A90C72B|nr:acyltransferase family protein [Rhodobacter sp. NTK016B]MBN8291637.1 acyltransferase [Rhodobacter sp. NTK016B]
MSQKYRADIDGLRAVAVLPVIAFHAGFPGFSGGFVGVDVFFVISGYLITGILAGDLAAGRYSIARFYERRARRILPALFVMMAVSAVVAHLLMMPPAFKDFSASVFSVALFLSNMLFISEVDYFAPSADAVPLLHTWSLAVEEQFYILFPLILWGLWRLGRARSLAWGVAAITLASLVFSEWAWRHYPAESFYFLPSRAWELGAGALCALIPARPGRALREGLGLAGLAAIVVAVVTLDRSVPFPSLWALLPVGGSVALILSEGSLAARLLSWRPIVAIGLVSYSAYLWHNPVFVFARAAGDHEPGTLMMLGLSGLSLVLAWLSWRFVEQPFRTGGARKALLPRRWQVFAASLAGIAVFVLFGLWGWTTEGRAALWLRHASETERRTYALFAPARELIRHLDDGDCRFNERVVGPDTPARLARCRAEYGPGLAIVGDSHAINLADALIMAEAAPFLYGMTQGNCRPDTPRDECGFDRFATLVEETPDLFSEVVFEVAGQRLIEGPGGRRTESLFRYYAPDAAIPEDDITLLTDVIAANEAYAAQLAEHVPVVWLSPRIELHIPDSWIMERGCDYAFALRPGQHAIFERLTTVIETMTADVPNLRVVDQPAALDLTMPEDFLTCERLLWRDGDHLGRAGLEWLGGRLTPVLVADPGQQ